jgi:hypothetical protein
MAKTKFVNAQTVVTSTFLNQIFGGLTTDDGFPDTDPLVSGHLHDGVDEDGHASKIDLFLHVTGQLDGANIIDGSIPCEKLAPECDFGPAEDNCCELLIITNDGRLVADSGGNILLKENP